jgi:segregation and condensation protein B
MFDTEVPKNDIEQSIEELTNQYNDDQFSLEVVHAGDGYQFMTKPAYQVSIGILLKHQSKKRLSNSALETLSIIAYKQPVTKTEVEQIRGVNCDYSIQRLLDKGLVEIKGKSSSIGRPLIYGTSDFFMEYFGINEMTELPTLKDLPGEENTIGEENI